MFYVVEIGKKAVKKKLFKFNKYFHKRLYHFENIDKKKREMRKKKKEKREK